MHRFISAFVVIALWPTAPLYAASVTYLSATGHDNGSCTAAQPCLTFVEGLFIASGQQGSRVSCLDPVSSEDNVKITASSYVADLDCPGGTALVSAGAGLEFDGANVTVKIRHMTYIADTLAVNAIAIGGSGTLILEDCVFEGFASGPALNIAPTGPLNLVIKNSRISNNVTGVLLKPQAGGSIKATFDHVTVTGNNGGGGIRTDSTNGVVNLDVSDSEVSNNGPYGINAVAVAGAGFQNIVGIRNSVIARNGLAGVQANGASVGVLVATTLLDQNAAGALSVMAGGNLFTYGNNTIIGPQGSSFTGAAALQ
jgi:hypothetical protein